MDEERAASPSKAEKTKDVSSISLACFLWFQGHVIVGTQWFRGLCTWDFADTPRLHEDIDAFVQGRAQVDPREFYPRVTEFKHDMYKDKPRPE